MKKDIVNNPNQFKFMNTCVSHRLVEYIDVDAKIRKYEDSIKELESNILRHRTIVNDIKKQLLANNITEQERIDLRAMRRETNRTMKMNTYSLDSQRSLLANLKAGNTEPKPEYGSYLRNIRNNLNLQPVPIAAEEIGVRIEAEHPLLNWILQEPDQAEPDLNDIDF